MLRTRIVQLLRVVLPLAALALLSVLFLLARKPDPHSVIPYAQGRFEDLSRAEGIGAPEFTTVTDDGATVTLRATRAVPGEGEDGTARDLTLDWRSRDGLLMVVTAPQAAKEGDRLTLDGGTRMALSTGWELTAPQLQAQLDAGVVSAAQTVDVTAPFGELQARTMRLGPDATGATVLELNGNVRLLYRP